MKEDRVITKPITLYPSQLEKVKRLMLAWGLRKFSAAMQRLVEEAPEPSSENQAAQVEPGG